MDAKEFVKNQRRLCALYIKHEECCPLFRSEYCNRFVNVELTDKVIDEAVDIVEKWAKENPIETNQSKLLKLFPNLIIAENKVFDLCPKVLDADTRCKGTYDISDNGSFECDCLGCKNEFWNSEYKEK